jgi:hypothetical protein
MEIILIIITSMIASANLVLFKDFYHYKKTYEALVSGEYVYNEHLSGCGVHYFTNTNDYDRILYFTDDSSIKLVNGGYLHNNFVTNFSPYSLYWYKKLNRWFKNNLVDSE